MGVLRNMKDCYLIGQNPIEFIFIIQVLPTAIIGLSYTYQNRPEKWRAKVIEDKVLEMKRCRELELSKSDRFRYRTRYFTDSGIIGSKEFVSANYQRFKTLFKSKHEKMPKTIKGLDGIYSLK